MNAEPHPEHSNNDHSNNDHANQQPSDPAKEHNVSRGRQLDDPRSPTASGSTQFGTAPSASVGGAVLPPAHLDPDGAQAELVAQRELTRPARAARSQEGLTGSGEAIKPSAPTYWLRHVVPDDALAVWGARLLVTQDGHVDFLPDRQGGGTGRHTSTLLQYLRDRIPLPDLLDIIGWLLREEHMHTRRSDDFILHLDQQVVVHASTNASAGYCYVSAWLTPPRPAPAGPRTTRTHRATATTPAPGPGCGPGRSAGEMRRQERAWQREDTLVTCRQCAVALTHEPAREQAAEGEGIWVDPIGGDVCAAAGPDHRGHAPDLVLHRPPADRPTRDIRTDLILTVPNDGYDYQVDLAGRLERITDLLLTYPLVSAVTTSGSHGSGYVEDIDTDPDDDLNTTRDATNSGAAVWTVIGFWAGDERSVTGVIRGRHQVDGSDVTTVSDQGCWAEHVLAATAQDAEAQARAVAHAHRADPDPGNEST